MKEFRKTKDGLFICEECERICKDKTVLSIHNIKIHNLSPKQYFDKWIKEDDEGICKICGNEIVFKRSDCGYKKTCCQECANIYSTIRSKEEIMKKYGVENPWQLEEVKQKIKKTNKERYGVEYYAQTKEHKESVIKTCQEKYGVNWPTQTEETKKKCKQTNLKNYGVEYNWQREDVKQQMKQTNLKKHGVEYPSQNTEIWKKQQRGAYEVKYYKNTNLWYQGTYEFDFIDKYLPIFPDLQRGPSIKYLFAGKNKVYHSDFFIPSLNLVIEIKSSWTLNVDLEIEEKKKATIANGFKYIMIMNKVYDDLNNIVL